MKINIEYNGNPSGYTVSIQPTVEGLPSDDAHYKEALSEVLTGLLTYIGEYQGRTNLSGAWSYSISRDLPLFKESN